MLPQVLYVFIRRPRCILRYLHSQTAVQLPAKTDAELHCSDVTKAFFLCC